jgi:hypothetical protein
MMNAESDTVHEESMNTFIFYELPISSSLQSTDNAPSRSLNWRASNSMAWTGFLPNFVRSALHINR